jgi:CYTH domain-containing protein
VFSFEKEKYREQIKRFLPKLRDSRKVNMIEIERKFLVKSDAFKDEAFNKNRIIQGFLSTNKKRIVRVRLKDEIGFLTIKGKSSNNGLSRFEWEKEIPKTEAKQLLKLCKKGIIDKMRHEVKVNNHIFEVDEFFGNNKGLIIAEVELKTETENFTKPKWLGKEVTGNVKYYNSQLSKQPYKTWNQ